MLESPNKNAFMPCSIFIRLLVSTEESLGGKKDDCFSSLSSVYSQGLTHGYADIRVINSHSVSIVESVNALNLIDFTSQKC